MANVKQAVRMTTRTSPVARTASPSIAPATWATSPLRRSPPRHSLLLAAQYKPPALHRPLGQSAPFSALSASSPRLSGNDRSSNPDPTFARPAPPALPLHLQREFEELVRKAQTPAAPPLSPEAAAANAKEQEQEQEQRAGGVEEEMHPDLRRKPRPEFQGDRNPLTGEVGGPKVEPLKHGESAAFRF